MVDLGFAISATARNSKKNFNKMQEIIKTFIEKYGSHRIAYSALTFGSTPTIQLRFSKSASSVDVESMQQNPGESSLDKALDGARELFKVSEGAREKALKILVVITDKKSDSVTVDVATAAARMKDDGVRIISIALGREADPQELEATTENGNDVLNVTDTSSPKKTVEKIMERVLDSKLQRKKLLVLVGYA